MVVEVGLCSHHTRVAGSRACHGGRLEKCLRRSFTVLAKDIRFLRFMNLLRLFSLLFSFLGNKAVELREGMRERRSDA